MLSKVSRHFQDPVLAGFNESLGFAEDRAVDEVTFCCSGVVEENRESSARTQSCLLILDP